MSKKKPMFSRFKQGKKKKKLKRETDTVLFVHTHDYWPW